MQKRIEMECGEHEKCENVEEESLWETEMELSTDEEENEIRGEEKGKVRSMGERWRRVRKDAVTGLPSVAVCSSGCDVPC